MKNSLPHRGDPLDILRSGPVGMPSETDLAASRDRLVPWLEAQVRTLPARQAAARQRRARQRWALAATALAAAAALPLGWWLHAPTASVQEAAAFAPTGAVAAATHFTLEQGTIASGGIELLQGSRLAVGSIVTTDASPSATLRSSEGFQVELANQTTVELSTSAESAWQRSLRLRRGAISLSVPKLPRGATLSVLTPNATVTVVGTKFHVAYSASGRTCVVVDEGTVRVQRTSQTELLTAGMRSGCDEADPAPGAASSTAVPPTAAALATERAASTSAPRSQGVGSTKAEASSLAEQNRLLAAALSAEQGGDRAGARRAYGLLLRRFPATTFRPEAEAGLRRVAAGVD